MAETANDLLGDFARLQRSPQAMASWHQAQQHLRQRQFASSLAAYQKLTQEFPGVPRLWAELGAASMGDLDFSRANQATDRAAALAPMDAPFLLSVGNQYCFLRGLNEALTCFERAVKADPASADARLTLAWWLERTRRLDEAWECINECLTRHPNHGRALYFKAFLLHRRGLNDDARAALQDLLKINPSPPVDVLADAHHLLGTLLDGFGLYAEALASLGQAKQLRCQMINVPAMEQNFENANRTRRELLAVLTPDTLRRWRDEAAANPGPHPLAFLGGAPRSGTTLMEQIMGAHPNICGFDELESFTREIVGPLHAPPSRGVTLPFLNDLPPATRAQLTSRYFKSLLRETEGRAPAGLLLDKNPATTAWLYVWLRLFPLSKIIIALRDPRDVIISSYFQNVSSEWAIVCYRSLERTAKLYSACMDVWLRLRDLGGFEWIETRYEDVVGNLEVEGKRMTTFLGLQWHESQTAFHETARRKYVHSPTYNEVTKPIYNKAIGRWEHYSEAMAPLQAGLEAYLRAFRYT